MIVFGVGVVMGVVDGFGCCLFIVFYVFFKYSYSIVCCRWFMVGSGAYVGFVVFVEVVVYARFFNISRAATSCICLASMASSLSVASSVIVSYVFSWCVFFVCCI
jgi:hypothetical protein